MKKHPIQKHRGPTYIERQQERRNAEYRLVATWTAQLTMDIISVILNDKTIMGSNALGKERLRRVGEEFIKVWPEYMQAITKNPEADYIRDKIDRQQQQIYGADALPWAERYDGWAD